MERSIRWVAILDAPGSAGACLESLHLASGGSMMGLECAGDVRHPSLSPMRLPTSPTEVYAWEIASHGSSSPY